MKYSVVLLKINNLFYTGLLDASVAETDFKSSIENFATIARNVAVSLLAVAIIYNGILMIVGGEEGKQKAKKSIPWMILGAILVLGAFSIAELIKQKIAFSR